MKAANFLNIVLALALLILCTRLHLTAAPAADAPAGAAEPAVQIIDSTDLAPGATGFGGPVPVEVEIREGVVARVFPKLPNDETPAFFERLEAAGFWQSWDGLPVAEAATARVDAVTSATYSSKAAIAHVRAALASAAGLPAPAPEPAAAVDRPQSPHRPQGPHPHSNNSPAPEAALAAIRAVPPDARPGDPYTAFEGNMNDLPEPVRDAMPLGDALAARATHRDFSPEPLTPQEISDLLWAANGINRPGEGKRTAPTAINRQEIDIYVCTQYGAWKWVDLCRNQAGYVCPDDLRGLTGRMNAGADNFALTAPVTLVYVVDFKRQAMQDRPLDALKYAAVDCGFIGQNVYLHCAAVGLHTVYLGSLDSEALSKALHLPPTSVPLFAQTVGRPAAP